MEAASGTIFKMEQSIKDKLVAAGTTSEAKAVTIQEADLDMQEENWLGYVAGGLFATVKKKGNKYYVEI
jgi:outer membrane lipoprotein SlyB